MRNSEQKDLAHWIELYNTSEPSPKPMDVGNHTNLEVTKARTEMKGSLYYPMSKNPRGKAIIINNICKW